MVTIATNAEVDKYVIFCPIEGKLSRFFFTVRRTSTNLVAMVGCHGDMVTMAAVSRNLLLYSSKGITSKFCKFLQNFSVRLLKFYEGLLPMATDKIPATSLFHNIISLNLVQEFNVFHLMYAANFIRNKEAVNIISSCHDNRIFLAIFFGSSFAFQISKSMTN